MFYSQSGEDFHILQNAAKYNLPHVGTFIDVGANDGIEFSNTAYFEKTLRWTGLLIEPNPKLTSLLRTNRTATVEACAVDVVEGKRTLVCPDNHQLAGFLRKDGKPIEVPTFRLDTLMRKHRLERVDLLSIDTEGTEIAVLESAGELLLNCGLVLVEFATKDIGNQGDELIRYMSRDFDRMQVFPYNLLFKRKVVS